MGVKQPTTPNSPKPDPPPPPPKKATAAGGERGAETGSPRANRDRMDRNLKTR